ncbi:MAG TPA: tetratricopeptide repeat protein [Terriglobales bacterium]
MFRIAPSWLAAVLLAGLAAAQVEKVPSSGKEPTPSQEPPRSENGPAPGESSSHSTLIDISPPPDDAKTHPFSSSSLADAEAEASGVKEFRAWDPHRAAKNIEVGDFYFKRKNYRAALDRYHEALEYKPDDAVANFRLAECFEKLNDPAHAAEHYQAYLKVLPHGEFSEAAQKALEKMGKGGSKGAAESSPQARK